MPFRHRVRLFVPRALAGSIAIADCDCKGCFAGAAIRTAAGAGIEALVKAT
jgi:hypothetical protein